MEDNQESASENRPPITQYSGDFLLRLAEQDLTFHQIEEALSDPNRVASYYDPRGHAWVILGQTPDAGTLLIVAREDTSLQQPRVWRLITARRATSREIEAYKQASRGEQES